MSFRISRMVEFRDTDAAGIVHFSVFFNYMEAVEHAYWRSLGVSVIDMEGGDKVSFPRVSVKCDYQKPLRFEDEFDIELKVAHVGTSSVKFAYFFTKDVEPIATGEMTAVCCLFPKNAPPKSTPIPDDIAKQLRASEAN